MPETVKTTFMVREDEKHHLNRHQWKWLRAQLGRWAGGQVDITLSDPIRDTQANRWYWGVLLKSIHLAWMRAGLYMEPEDIHDHFKRKYLPVTYMGPDGMMHTRGGTTTTLTKHEFHDYILSILSDDDVVAAGVWEDMPESLTNYHIRDHA